MIKHVPTFDVSKIEKNYSEKDNVDVAYVCTTEINQNNLPCDVFFRETPHPKFGNRYFGIFAKLDGSTWICNADDVENYEFAMISNLAGDLIYSRYRHDFVSSDTGSFVDGGRAYTRTSGHVTFFKIKDGVFIKTT